MFGNKLSASWSNSEKSYEFEGLLNFPITLGNCAPENKRFHVIPGDSFGVSLGRVGKYTDLWRSLAEGKGSKKLKVYTEKKFRKSLN